MTALGPGSSRQTTATGEGGEGLQATSVVSRAQEGRGVRRGGGQEAAAACGRRLLAPVPTSNQIHIDGLPRLLAALEPGLEPAHTIPNPHATPRGAPAGPLPCRHRQVTGTVHLHRSLQQGPHCECVRVCVTFIGCVYGKVGAAGSWGPDHNDDIPDSCIC